MTIFKERKTKTKGIEEQNTERKGTIRHSSAQARWRIYFFNTAIIAIRLFRNIQYPGGPLGPKRARSWRDGPYFVRTRMPDPTPPFSHVFTFAPRASSGWRVGSGMLAHICTQNSTLALYRHLANAKCTVLHASPWPWAR